MVLSQRYIQIALVYLIIGMLMGLHMAITLDYTHKVTHVHLLMLGFIIQVAYAGIIKGWLAQHRSALMSWQFYLHQLGTVLLIAGFVMLFGGYAHPAIAGSLAGLGALLALAAVSLMLWLFTRVGAKQAD